MYIMGSSLPTVIYICVHVYSLLMRANKLETALSRDHLVCLAPPDMFFSHELVHVLSEGKLNVSLNMCMSGSTHNTVNGSIEHCMDYLC